MLCSESEKEICDDHPLELEKGIERDSGCND